MNHKILALALIALVPGFAVAPTSSAETVDAVCSTVTVLTGSDLSESFTATSCTNAVGYVAVRNPTDSTVSWTITTDSATRSCTWPAGAGTTCNGSGAIPASIGSSYTVTISSTSGDVVFTTTPSADV